MKKLFAVFAVMASAVFTVNAGAQDDDTMKILDEAAKAKLTGIQEVYFVMTGTHQSGSTVPLSSLLCTDSIS